jgi:uncharacterized protein
MSSSVHTGPVVESERIRQLDVLRGLAVLGILGTNIQHFAMFAGTTRNPTLWGNLEGADFWVYALTFNLVFQKFLPIFSMLFGAGIVLAAERREAAGLDSAALHYRRMATLLLIGLVHAYLIWYGDILFVYAVCGMAVFPLRRLSPRLLLTLGIVLLAVGPLIEIVFFMIPAMLGAGGGGAGPSIDTVVSRDLEAFRGPWIEQLRMRAHYAFEVQTQGLAILLFWRASGIMLIGMALYKLRVLTGSRSPRLYAALLAIALAVALPLTVAGFYANLLTEWQNGWLRKLAEWIVYFFGILMSLGWASVVMLIGNRRAWSFVTRPLAAVGRMALTNYLLQSLICTFIFYGHGLGLYGQVERTGQAAIVAGVWLSLLILSPLWLRFFRFGPVEWVWRMLAYGERQPFLRA